jgi:murein DD-endopeptidase MepM/ murein hydrolase activator NlpD
VPAAGGVPALTRAELRRRAEAERADAAAPAVPITRRATRARFVVAAPSAAGDGEVDEIPVALLPDVTVGDVPAVAVEVGPDVAVDDLPDVSVDELPDLAPEALQVPGLRDDSPAESEDRVDEIIDEFEAAARLFAFTGETPVQVAASALADDEPQPAVSDVEGERRRGFSFKRVATASFSVGVLGVVGLLTVGMTTPLEAVAAAKGTTAAASLTQLVAGDVEEADEDIQAYVAPSDVQNVAVERSDSFEATSLAEIAAESGISNFSNWFINDPTSAIQWPFAVGVPITYGFGIRSGSMHEGLDFVPGAGAPVQAVADGTVRIATESGGAYGVTVVIDHVIDGELVSSRYAHMQYDSLQVEAGDQVTVGTFIGRTGNTGRSYGAHMHFEILAGGTTAIDPEPWLRAHAGG